MVPQLEVPPEKTEKKEVEQTETAPQQTVPSSNTSEAGSPPSRSQGIIPEAQENSSNLNNGKESSSVNSSNTDPMKPSSLQHHNDNQAEEKRSAENGVTGDPQLDERLKVVPASDEKGSTPCAKDAGSSDNTESSSAVHVNNVDVVESSKINNDFSTSKNNFSPSSNEINCGSTKQKRKAEECVALDSTSEDDLVLKGDGQRQVKKLKIAHNPLSSSSVKNGLCSGSKDGGHTSDDSMEADEPDALEGNTDVEAQLLGDGNTSKDNLECTSQDVQTEKNKESWDKEVIERATVNGRTDDAMNTDFTKSDTENNSFEDGDGTLVIQDVTSQSDSKENGADETSKNCVLLDELSSSTKVQSKEGTNEIEISSVSSVGISNSAVHKNDTAETNNKLVIQEENSSKSEIQPRSPSKCENRVQKLDDTSPEPEKEKTLSRTSSLTDLSRDDINLKVFGGEEAPKSEFLLDSGLDMQCNSEDLSDAQNVFYKKLNNDFNLLIATTQAYLPRVSAVISL